MSFDSQKTVYLYDTTLRDGAQTEGVEFSVKDKETIAGWVDALGIDYLEGGWPGANETDTAFFTNPPALAQTALTAFGMTRRKSVSAREDSSLNLLLQSCAKAICLVGKSWKQQAVEALKVTPDENKAMIRDSMQAVKSAGKEALFDAEHFFDGYKSDPTYALSTLGAALEGGADWLVLCDTNGGTLPHDVFSIVTEVRSAFPEARLGFHAHNDKDCATANSLMAVQAGCTMLQGTLSGLGERCGNANLLTLAPILHTMGYKTGVDAQKMMGLKALADKLDILLDRDRDPHRPFVGDSAFAHKAGLHASAVRKNPAFYEHTPPESVGNRRKILMSKQAGMANLRVRLERLGLDTLKGEQHDEKLLSRLLAQTKARSDKGYSFDKAEGSFAVLAMKTLYGAESPFVVKRYEATAVGGLNGDGEKLREAYASVYVKIQDKVKNAESLGEGPVHALDKALREALVEEYPVLETTELSDFKVRLLNRSAGTSATTCVFLTMTDHETGKNWTTMGISSDIVNAAMKALSDAYAHTLCKERILPHDQTRDHSCATAAGGKYRHDGKGHGQLRAGGAEACQPA